jgi:hypothetical protein
MLSEFCCERLACRLRDCCRLHVLSLLCGECRIFELILNLSSSHKDLLTMATRKTGMKKSAKDSPAKITSARVCNSDSLVNDLQPDLSDKLSNSMLKIFDKKFDIWANRFDEKLDEWGKRLESRLSLYSDLQGEKFDDWCKKLESKLESKSDLQIIDSAVVGATIRSIPDKIIDLDTTMTKSILESKQLAATVDELDIWLSDAFGRIRPGVSGPTISDSDKAVEEIESNSWNDWSWLANYKGSDGKSLDKGKGMCKSGNGKASEKGKSAWGGGKCDWGKSSW